MTVWKASRGFGGKTFAMAALAFAEIVTLHASVSLLGGSGEQAVRVLEYLTAFWQKPQAPHWALASDPAKQRTTLVWGNKITALMASMASVSGPHPQRLRIDEVDLVDIPIMDQALGQPLEKDGVDAHVLLSSAHYEADGTLTEVLKRAQTQGWGVHQWCWRETCAPHGWISLKQLATTRATVTKSMWDVQYDLQDPSPEGRAIDPEKVERMFLLPEVLSPVLDEFPYREFEPPVVGASYSTGADWARSSDYVEIATLRDDVYPLRLVAYQRFRRKATPYIVAMFEIQHGRYPGTAAHDATSLGGQIMSDLIGSDTDGSNMEGIVLSSARRRFLFVNFIVAVESEDIVAPRVALLHRQLKFVTNKDLWGAGHPPDGFVALAMAYQASQAATKPLRLVTGIPPIVRPVAGLPAMELGPGEEPPPPPGPPLEGFDRALAFLTNGNGNGSGSHE